MKVMACTVRMLRIGITAKKLKINGKPANHATWLPGKRTSKHVCVYVSAVYFPGANPD